MSYPTTAKVVEILRERGLDAVQFDHLVAIRHNGHSVSFDASKFPAHDQSLLLEACDKACEVFGHCKQEIDKFNEHVQDIQVHTKI